MSENGPRTLQRLFSQCPQGVGDALAERAALIGWRLPDRVAVAELIRPAPAAVAPAVGNDVLLTMDRNRPLMMIPEPEAAGRSELLKRALVGWSGAIGPPVPLAEAAKSLRWAHKAVRLIADKRLPAGEVLNCAEHGEALILLPAEELVEHLARRCLAPLLACHPARSHRLEETLLAWLQTRGGAPEVAARLGVHPQTVRYRLRQIRQLWGEEVDDPDRRFELELVLRTRRLNRGAV